MLIYLLTITTILSKLFNLKVFVNYIYGSVDDCVVNSNFLNLK